MAKTLTAIAVKNYQPNKNGRREVPDGGCAGLYLVIQDTGHKSWALRFRRPNGRPAKLTLGSVDLSGREAESGPVLGTPLTLASARTLAAEIHRQRARGRDVVADHDTAKRRREFEQKAEGAATFSIAARDFVEQYAVKKTRRWQDTARLLGLDPKHDFEMVNGGIASRWGDKSVGDIDGHDIYHLVDEVRLHGVPGRERRSDQPTEALAKSVLSILSKMFNWLVQHRRAEKNPCDGVHRPDEPMARDRVLNDAEIAKFWRAAGTVREPFGQAFKLLLLTGCRRNEVAGMRRDELSDDLSVWTIPGARTKNKKPHVVPLPPLARAVLGSLVGDGGFVFTTTGVVPISGFAPVKKRLDAAMKIPPWVVHDLRRTAATGMAEIGIAPHIVEACLNHISGARSGVAGIYNRAAYAVEKKAALQRWADHVEGLTSGRKGKIVPIRGAR